MRATSKITNSNSLLYISKNFQKLSKATSQVAMEQQVIEVDDNPLSANIGLKMLNMIGKSEQYNRNVKSGIGNLNLLDGHLAAVKSDMDRINSLVIGAANDPSATSATRMTDASSLNSIYQALLAGANARDGSRYLFGGTNTTTTPFTMVNGRYVHYAGNGGDMNILIDHKTTMRINSTGSDLFGNMTTKISSRDMNPRVNLGTDSATPLADLNAGQGVPKGKITVRYSAYPEGLEVDLSGCDTLEDVKDRIEQATADASRALDPSKNPWLNSDNLDWRDLQDRYVRVTMNPDGNGISLQERDRGEPLPEPTAAEARRGLGYTGAAGDGTGLYPGGTGVAEGGALPADGGGAVITGFLRVDDYAMNRVAAGLGIKGVSNQATGFLHGSDLNPVISEGTLLADLEGYNDGSYTITNGGKPSAVIVKETSTDTNNMFNNWQFSGASKGDNTGPEGELYARAVNKGTAAEPRIEIEVYSRPFSESNPPRASDLVATGLYDAKSGGGTVVFREANNSGLSGSVGVVIPPSMIPSGDGDGSITGNGKENATQSEYNLPEDSPAGTIVLGGAMQLQAPLSLTGPMTLKADTTFKAGQVFKNNVTLPDGSVLSAGTPLDADTVLPAGETVEADGPLLAGTVLAAAQEIATSDGFPAGTTIPRGSYYADPPEAGFPADMILPGYDARVSISLRIDFQDSLQATVHVPAFEEEQSSNGVSRDILNIASGWNIRGLDKPPAAGYDENHPITTDLDGNVSVNYRYDAASNSMIVELSRPASGSTPAAVIATGTIALGKDADGNNNMPPALKQSVSGRIELVGAPGFEQVSGSVYIELPAGVDLAAESGAGAARGNGAENATQNTYRLTSPAPAGNIVLGGAMRLEEDLALAGPMTLKADTTFKKGQTFQNDIALPGGGILRAGTPLPSDTVIMKGTTVDAGTLLAGTVLAAGQDFAAAGTLPAGTTIPRGSYYADPASPGFPATDMIAGYDVRATFATVEDLNRAIEQAGVYVKAGISADGRGIEFQSSLAGAWLTVSEDFDCYEQMGDTNRQLTGLDLSGLVKGVNTDRDGNVYTEVVYYPPDPLHPDNPVRVTSSDGKITELAPGYYVRVYSDPEQMGKNFADRDNTKMVAEGFIPAGEWNPAFDPAAAVAAALAGDDYGVSPFLPKDGLAVGRMPGLVLEERNGSGIRGTVNLDYHGEKIEYTMSRIGTREDGSAYADFDYATRDNANITVFPGGLRPGGAHGVVMQEWDLSPVTPGENCDYAGTFHGKVTADATDASRVSITLFKDSSNTQMSARNNPNDPDEPTADGKVTLYQTDRHGNIALSADGTPIVMGTVTLPGWPDSSTLGPGESEAFELKTGGLRNGGQQREENLFSTINDIMDALNQNDAEALGKLIGKIQIDLDRATAARGDAGARNKRLMLLSERHADDVLNFTNTLTSRVGMDDQALAMAVMNYQASTNAYNAAMQVSAQVMQLSLLQYL